MKDKSFLRRMIKYLAKFGHPLVLLIVVKCILHGENIRKLVTMGSNLP